MSRDRPGTRPKLRLRLTLKLEAMERILVSQNHRRERGLSTLLLQTLPDALDCDVAAIELREECMMAWRVIDRLSFAE